MYYDTPDKRLKIMSQLPRTTLGSKESFTAQRNIPVVEDIDYDLLATRSLVICRSSARGSPAFSPRARARTRAHTHAIKLLAYYTV